MLGRILIEGMLCKDSTQLNYHLEKEDNLHRIYHRCLIM